jgi:hypothetical protein|tara:strand:+ start:882 stop:1031 length:150 start_codon:yes stop_codon:yes gene_type:complete
MLIILTIGILGTLHFIPNGIADIPLLGIAGITGLTEINLEIITGTIIIR